MKVIECHPPIIVRPFDPKEEARTITQKDYVKTLFLSPKWSAKLENLMSAVKIEAAFEAGSTVKLEDADHKILKEIAEEFFPYSPPYVAKQLLPFVKAISDAKEEKKE